MMGELRINDRVVASMNNPDPADKLVTLKYLWDPAAPGRYVLGARAQNNEGAWGPLTESLVNITEPTATPPAGATPTLTMTPTEIFAPSPTPTETLTPTVVPTAGFANISITPDLVYYGVCSPDEVQVSAEATAPGGGSPRWCSFTGSGIKTGMSQDGSTAPGTPRGGRYAKTVNMNTLAEQTGFGESFGTFTLEVQLVIQNSLGETTRSPVYGDVVVEYCRR